ncbi:hypothetical protein BaRGS_00017024, partial [Batillaria attramentaria]
NISSMCAVDAEYNNEHCAGSVERLCHSTQQSLGTEPGTMTSNCLQTLLCGPQAQPSQLRLPNRFSKINP